MRLCVRCESVIHVEICSWLLMHSRHVTYEEWWWLVLPVFTIGIGVRSTLLFSENSPCPTSLLFHRDPLPDDPVSPHVMMWQWTCNCDRRILPITVGWNQKKNWLEHSNQSSNLRNGWDAYCNIATRSA